MRINLAGQNLNSWPTTIDPRVTELRIQNNNLTEIPDDISNLQSLTRIWADGNKIKIISKNLVNLPNFTDLRLSTNELVTIPETVFYLKKLYILLLNHNLLAEIDENIGNLKTLTQLHLQHNTLKTLPTEIGKLENLTHLILDNNPIEYLPPSIANLKKLQHIGLTGTNLPLPPDYSPNEVQKVIQFILENQKIPAPGLNIKSAYVFSNLSKTSLIDKFNKAFEKFSQKNEVTFKTISEITDITPNTNYVLLVIGFDVHQNPDLVFQIIKKCIELKISYKILFQKDTNRGIEDIHIEKGAELSAIRTRFEKEYQPELIHFSSIEEIDGLILDVLREHRPEVIINSLELTNIGHFEHAIVNFDKNITCIVGENGQGKSSILRALTLAIIGSENPKISKNESTKDLLRIKSISGDGKVNYCEIGEIVLKYSLDAEEYENKVVLYPKDEGRIVDLVSSGNFELNYGEYNLKSLIIGFPQLRGRLNQTEKINKYSQPHVDDLLPLLKHEDDQRLDSFINWIANLYGEAIKSSNSKETREFAIIEYVFKIIADLTGSSLSFVTVQQFTPPIVIVSSNESPNGVPLNLISQGFKIVIGWIGYFIQRRVEAFPLSNPISSSYEKSVLIIDEIDSSIHPVWQSRLLEVLRNKFPSTQIICTTHSPLMVAGLDRNQILEIQKTDERLTIEQNTFDTWVISYLDILREIFNTTDFKPKFTKETLLASLDGIKEDSLRYQQITDTIERITENEEAIDEVKKYENKLSLKEKELDKLIEEYQQKINPNNRFN